MPGMRTWYTFSAKSDDVAELSIFDYIGYYGVEAAQFKADLDKITAGAIEISINSPGGDVFQAVAILNMLRNSGKAITTKVLGIAASAASYIMLAGDKRIMPDNTMQMLHNASSGAYGNAAELGELVDVLKKVDQNLHATFVSRTGQTAEQIAELLSKDTYLTAAECLERGLCDEVTPSMKLTAAFDTANLPENVKALFEVKAPEAPFAERAGAIVAAAGLGEFAQSFIDLTTIEAVEAAVAEAREVVALCKFANVEAAEHVRQPLAKVREVLCAARAAADEALHIDTAPKGTIVTPEAKAPITAASIWAKHRNRK
jgi:ATP-dependent Clp endopeptidase proteolytic subunit ClpP